MKKNESKTSLYVRSKLLEKRHKSLRRWSIDNGYDYLNVWQVVQRWTGKKGFPRSGQVLSILKKLESDIGENIFVRG